jgi:hypothetical protein
MKLTPRGYFVAGFLTALAIGALWYITSHIWFLDGAYCLNTLENCLAEQASVNGGNS